VCVCVCVCVRERERLGLCHISLVLQVKYELNYLQKREKA